MDKALQEHIAKAIMYGFRESYGFAQDEPIGKEAWMIALNEARHAMEAMQSYKRPLPFVDVTQEELDAGDKIRDAIHSTQNPEDLPVDPKGWVGLIWRDTKLTD